MSIGPGIKFFDDPEATLKARGASANASSGNVIAENALDPNPETFWRSVDSGDTLEESLEVVFPEAKVIDRLLLRNHNLKSYIAEWYDGDQYRDFCNVTGLLTSGSNGVIESDYTKDTSYYEFDAVKASRVRVRPTSTQEILNKP